MGILSTNPKALSLYILEKGNEEPPSEKNRNNQKQTICLPYAYAIKRLFLRLWNYRINGGRAEEHRRIIGGSTFFRHFPKTDKQTSRKKPFAYFFPSIFENFAPILIR